MSTKNCAKNNVYHLPCAVAVELAGVYAVLLYHIWPSEFSVGFLGIDIFFLAFGFHIGHELFTAGVNGEEQPKNLRDFLKQLCLLLWAQFVRFIPLFALTVCSAFVAGTSIFFGEQAQQRLRNDLGWALVLGTNFQLNDAHWTMELIGVPHQGPFFHLWAIAVLFQLCLTIVPILKLIHWLLAKNAQKLFCKFVPGSTDKENSSSSTADNANAIGPLIGTFVLLLPVFVASAAFYLFFSTKMSQTMGMPWSRAWQFLLGTFVYMAYEASNVLVQNSMQCSDDMCKENCKDIGNEQQKQRRARTLALIAGKRQSKRWLSLSFLIAEHCIFYSICIGLALLFFLPSSLVLWPSLLQRKTLLANVATLGGAFLLYFYPARLKKSILPTRFTLFLAKQLQGLPFTLYLLHWPLATFLRFYFGVTIMNVEIGLISIVVISITSLFVHLLFNGLFLRHYLAKKSQHSTTILLIVGSAYAISIFLWTNPTNNGAFGGAGRRSVVTSGLPLFNTNDDRLERVPFRLESAKTFLEQLQVESYRPQLVPALELAHKIKLNELMKEGTFVFDPLDRIIGNKSDEFVRENGIQVDNRFVNRIFEWSIEGNGTERIMVFGNSHTLMIWKELEALFHGNYGRFDVISVPACMPMFPDDWRVIYGISCAKVTQSLLNTLKRVRPDKLFLLFKWYEELQSMPFDEQNAVMDSPLQQMQQFLTNAQQHVRQRIFISKPNLLFPNEIAHQLAKRLWLGGNAASPEELSGLHKAYKLHLDENHWSLLRLEHLNCAKCQFLDFALAFCGPDEQREESEGKTRTEEAIDQMDRMCQAFDPDTQLAYFTDTNHFSYFGRLRAKQFLANSSIL